MKKNDNTNNILGWIAVGLFAVALVLSGLVFSNALKEVSRETIAKTPSAILASAGAKSEKGIAMPVVYYDQRADECINIYNTSLRKELYARQFEWGKCGYEKHQIEQGLVEYNLDENYNLVGKEGELLSNHGSDKTRWFTTVEEKSKSYTGVLQLTYDEEKTSFYYKNEDFYPLDNAEFSNGDFVNEDGHNHLFTMSFALPFNVFADGEESFSITADDDTFVFVGTELAIDMGGIHGATTGRLAIHENGEVYAGVEKEELAYTGINVKKGDNAIIRIFHADRDSYNSVLKFEFVGMNINLTESKFAGVDEGVQVAYDPTTPGEVAPLGVSSIFTPDKSGSYVVALTAGGILIVAITVFFVVAIRFVIKDK